MQITSGSSSRGSALSSIEPVGPLSIGRLAFLAGLGVLTVLLHETFHYPLKLPGHHGLEGMALLVLGRLSCTSRWAATIVCASAATASAGIGASLGLSAAALTLAPGVALDLFVMAWPMWRTQLWVLPILVAFAHATKPLLRWGLAEMSGLQFGSLKAGVFYPVSTHLAYGLAGAFIAVVMWRVTMRRLNER